MDAPRARARGVRRGGGSARPRPSRAAESSSRPGSSPGFSAARSTRGRRRWARSRWPTRSSARRVSRPRRSSGRPRTTPTSSRRRPPSSRAAAAPTGSCSRHAPDPGNADGARTARRRRRAARPAVDRVRQRRRSAAPRGGRSRAYGDPRRTVGDAYVDLLRTLLAPLGIPVLDASHPAVLSASLPVLRDALTSARAVERALRQRGDELRSAGFEPQVEDMPGLALVFARDGARKRRLAAGRARHAMARRSRRTCCSVPIVEHAILPTVAYWAGPGRARLLRAGERRRRRRWDDRLRSRCRDGRVRCWSPTWRPCCNGWGSSPMTFDCRTPPSAGSRARRWIRERPPASPRCAPMSRALDGRLGPEPRELGLDAVVQGAIGSLQHRVDRLERRLLAGVSARESPRGCATSARRAARCIRSAGDRSER